MAQLSTYWEEKSAQYTTIWLQIQFLEGAIVVCRHIVEPPRSEAETLLRESMRLQIMLRGSEATPSRLFGFARTLGVPEPSWDMSRAQAMIARASYAKVLTSLEGEQKALQQLFDNYPAKEPPDWFDRREAVFQREKGRCEGCSREVYAIRSRTWKDVKYHVHHKQAFAKGGTHALDNLELLCPSCHMKKHRTTRYYEKKKKEKKRERKCAAARAEQRRRALELEVQAITEKIKGNILLFVDLETGVGTYNGRFDEETRTVKDIAEDLGITSKEIRKLGRHGDFTITEFGSVYSDHARVAEVRAFLERLIPGKQV